MEGFFVQAVQLCSSWSITRRRCFTSIVEDEGGNEANLLRHGVSDSRLSDKWEGTGADERFTEMPTSRFVESAFWNFDSMFVPQQHPAREVQDTFYVKSEYSF